MSDLQIQQDHAKSTQLVRILLQCLLIRKQSHTGATLGYDEYTKEVDAINEARAYILKLDKEAGERTKPKGVW